MHLLNKRISFAHPRLAVSAALHKTSNLPSSLGPLVPLASGEPAMPSDLVQEDAGPAHARLTLAGLFEHQRLWWFLPTGCADLWIAANRPCFGALIAAHAAADPRAIGIAVDSILAIPAECLVRSRGGRRQTVNSIRSRLRSTAASAPGRPQPWFWTPLSAHPALPSLLMTNGLLKSGAQENLPLLVTYVAPSTF